MCDTAATREEMREASLPIAYRDTCANLLIPLNRCRKDTYYMPWKCEVGPPYFIFAFPMPARPNETHNPKSRAEAAGHELDDDQLEDKEDGPRRVACHLHLQARTRHCLLAWIREPHQHAQVGSAQEKGKIRQAISS